MLSKLKVLLSNKIPFWDKADLSVSIKISLLGFYLATFGMFSYFVWQGISRGIVISLALNFVAYVLLVLSRRSFKQQWILIILLAISVGSVCAVLPIWGSPDVTYVVAAGVNHVEKGVNFYNTTYGQALKVDKTILVPNKINTDLTYPYGYLYYEAVNLFYRIAGNYENTFLLLRFANLFLFQLFIWLLAKSLQAFKTRVTYLDLLFFVGLNPMLLQDLVTNAHQEVFALPLIAAALWLFVKNKYLLSIILIVLAIQVKLSYMFYLPFVFLYAIQQIPNSWKRIIFTAETFFAVLILSVPYPLFYHVMPWTPGMAATSQVLINTPSMFIYSMFSAFYTSVQHLSPNATMLMMAKATTLISRFASLCLVALAGWLMLRGIRKNMTMKKTFVYIWLVYFFYNFVFSSAFLSWHIFWAFPLLFFLFTDGETLEKIFIYGGIVLFTLLTFFMRISPYWSMSYFILVFVLVIFYLLNHNKIKGAITNWWSREVGN